MSLEAGGAGGVVVNVSSTCGVTCQGDMFATPAYTASKHAVTAMTRTFGVNIICLDTRSLISSQHKFWFERTGVSVVAVAPYYIDTPFLGSWADWTPDTAAQRDHLSAPMAALKRRSGAKAPLIGGTPLVRSHNDALRRAEPWNG